MLMYIRKLSESRRSRYNAGTSTVEYGLLVAAIAAVTVLFVFSLGRYIS